MVGIQANIQCAFLFLGGAQNSRILHLDRALAGWHKAGDNAHGCRFSRAVWAQKSKDFAPFDIEGDVFNG